MGQSVTHTSDPSVNAYHPIEITLIPYTKVNVTWYNKNGQVTVGKDDLKIKFKGRIKDSNEIQSVVTRVPEFTTTLTYTNAALNENGFLRGDGYIGINPNKLHLLDQSDVEGADGGQAISILSSQIQRPSA